MSSRHSPSSKFRKKQAGQKASHQKGSASLADELQALMEECPNAEAVNARVIMPFMQALVALCDARGYVFNIYGNNCNIAITPGNHSEALYRLIDVYLDEAEIG